MAPFRPSQAPFVAFKRSVSRRRFLAGTGVLLALPMLDAMKIGRAHV